MAAAGARTFIVRFTSLNIATLVISMAGSIIAARALSAEGRGTLGSAMVVLGLIASVCTLGKELYWARRSFPNQHSFGHASLDLARHLLIVSGIGAPLCYVILRTMVVGLAPRGALLASLNVPLSIAIIIAAAVGLATGNLGVFLGAKLFYAIAYSIAATIFLLTGVSSANAFLLTHLCINSLIVTALIGYLSRHWPNPPAVALTAAAPEPEPKAPDDNQTATSNLQWYIAHFAAIAITSGPGLLIALHPRADVRGTCFIAFSFLSLHSLLTSSIQKWGFSVLSSARDEHRRLARQAFVQTSISTILCVTILAGIAPPLIPLIFGSQYVLTASLAVPLGMLAIANAAWLSADELAKAAGRVTSLAVVIPSALVLAVALLAERAGTGFGAVVTLYSLAVGVLASVRARAIGSV